MSYAVARIEDVESLRTRHGYDWHSIRHHFDVRAFGVNANVAVEPGVIVEEHDETHGDGGQEELYVVVSGHATFTLEGEEVDAPAGTLVFVRDPAVKRAAVAHEAGTTLLCVGGRAGQPFRISNWEYSRRAEARVKAGDREAAVRIMEELLAERPDDPVVLYDVACFESLAGRREVALEHLRIAFEADPSLVEHARTDTDLDSIRDDPSVPRLEAADEQARSISEPSARRATSAFGSQYLRTIMEGDTGITVRDDAHRIHLRSTREENERFIGSGPQ